MASKKVVFIADCLTTQSAGIHYYAAQMIPRVISRYDQHQYYHITSEPYPIAGSENVVIPIKAWPLHYRTRYFREIPQVIKKINADIAIEMAHFGPFSLPGDIKRVVMIHDLTPILFPQYHPRYSVIWHRFFLPRLLRKVDAILTNSHTTSQDIIDRFGISMDQMHANYSQSAGANAASQQTKDFSDLSPLRVLTVGTIEPRKRHQLIFDALKRVKRKIIWTIIGGTGWDIDTLVNQLKTYKSDTLTIHLEGYVDDTRLSQAYQESHLLVYASAYEGFGMPVLESMSTGLPVLLSDISIHREVADDAGLYFDDVQEITKLIESVNTPQLIDRSSQCMIRADEINQKEVSIPFLD